MKRMEESVIFMGGGIMKTYAMMPHGDSRIGIGKKLYKVKKAKRRQTKQGRRTNR